MSSVIRVPAPIAGHYRFEMFFRTLRVRFGILKSPGPEPVQPVKCRSCPPDALQIALTLSQAFFNRGRASKHILDFADGCLQIGERIPEFVDDAQIGVFRNQSDGTADSLVTGGPFL